MSAGGVLQKFEDIGSINGLKKLDQYLLHNSYIKGYQASEVDFELYSKFSSIPSPLYKSIYRWYKHIGSLSGAQQFYNDQHTKTISQPGQQPESKTEQASDSKVQDKKADDFDPFADDTDDDDDDAAESKKAIQIKKKDKPAVIERSQLVLFVKPVSIDTDLNKLEKIIKGLEIEGVQWSEATKQVPIAYGLMKLQIGCNIVNSLVQTDDIILAIECVGLSEEKKALKIAASEAGEDFFEDDEECEGLVSSVEIASFNKL